jgi:hypothetical protein
MLFAPHPLKNAFRHGFEMLGMAGLPLNMVCYQGQLILAPIERPHVAAKVGAHTKYSDLSDALFEP